MSVDNIGIDDIDRESIEIFRREAVKKGRMSKEDLNISNKELLDHLDLLVDGRLKRAAVMLFYKKPGRIISGCYVKIGKFVRHVGNLEYLIQNIWYLVMI